MTVPALVFDLDGTISDPALGFSRSINAALAVLGYASLGTPAQLARLAPGQPAGC